MNLTHIEETVDFLTQEGISNPEIGVVLGTGLGKLVDEISPEKVIEYTEIPNFPVSTVEYHKGRLIYGIIGNKKILAMQGRFHYYEGYDMQQITFPIRVMKKLGVKNLLLSNAGGAMNITFKKGSLMLLDDHINLLPDNPLRGQNFEELGPRFVDMSRPYSESINKLFIESAEKHNITLHSGVYVAVPGPNFETPAEYRYLHAAGADVVGMSTVPEVIVANHAGLPCAAVSVLTDECDPDNLLPFDIDEIIEIAGKAEEKLITLFLDVIQKL
jgi:purine-nucleoside phosphorylase